METQIDLMTEQLEYQKLHGLLWEQVASIMNKSPAEIASYIQANNSEYWGKSPIGTQESLRTVLFQAQQWEAFRKDTGDIKTLISGLFADQNKAAFDEFNKSMKQQFGDLWTSDSSAAVRDIFMKTLAETGDITKAIEAVRGTDTYKKVKEAKEKKDNKTKTTTTDKNKKKTTNTDKNQTKHWGYNIVKSSDGGQTWTLYGDRKYGFQTQNAAQVAGNNAKPSDYSFPGGAMKYQVRTWSYSKGGVVPETGMALVHSKEGVLTASQMSVLKNDIMGNSKNSLMNLLLQFREITAGNASQADYATIDRGSGSPVIIEKAVVEMNVAKLANSYDARQAGKDALNEMVKIARKTGVQGVGR